MKQETRFYTIDNRTFKEKVRDGWESLKVKTGEFIVRHKDEIIFWAPIAAGIVGTGIKAVGKAVVNGQRKEIKELYVYDNRLGHYWKLKRELTNNEWLEIDRRKKRGERLSDILDDLRVLK